jgi:hypothetical protein
MPLTKIIADSPDKNPDDNTKPTRPVPPKLRCEVPTEPASDLAPDPFDPASLRLGSAEVVGIGVKRVITNVAVVKPSKQEFVRVHRSADYRLDTATFEDSVDRQHYLVTQPLWNDLSSEIKPVRLVTAITRHGSLFLWPAVLPAPDGRANRWHDSMLAAQGIAVEHWVRVQADMAAGEYGIFRATGSLPEPDWPDLTFKEILRLAFQGRFIDSMDHPVLRALRGEI